MLDPASNLFPLSKRTERAAKKRTSEAGREGEVPVSFSAPRFRVFFSVPLAWDFSRYFPDWELAGGTEMLQFSSLWEVINCIIIIQFTRFSRLFLYKQKSTAPPIKAKAFTKGTGYKLNRCKFRRFSYYFYPEQQVCMRSTVTQRTRDSVVPPMRFVR